MDTCSLKDLFTLYPHVFESSELKQWDNDMKLEFREEYQNLSSNAKDKKEYTVIDVTYEEVVRYYTWAVSFWCDRCKNIRNISQDVKIIDVFKMALCQIQIQEIRKKIAAFNRDLNDEKPAITNEMVGLK